MNNYQDQSNNEPVECSECKSSMTEVADKYGRDLICDNPVCYHVVELTEAEQYEADAKADHVTEQIPNV
jgi:hypothetical protein